MSGADLNSATVRGDRAAVEKLLADGVSPDYADVAHNSAYPLHRCAWRGFPEIAELLLKHGATVDPTNAMGATPLMNAAMTNNPDVAKVLLAHGADTRLKMNDGKTAADIAQSSSPAVAALLAAS
jgi:ankyrin repeat protein